MKISFLSLLILPCILSYSQEAKWDSTFRPNSYSLKVEQFRGYPDSPGDIIFLGNSITAGTDWMELLGNTSVRNRGISGDITYGVLERLDEVTEGNPAKIFILIGINDIARNIPDSLILDNYKKIIKRIRHASPGTAVYFHNLLPVNNEFTPARNHFNKDEHVLFINEELAKICREEKVTLIDLYNPFKNAENKLDKKYTYDGLHLTHAGYLLWASLLKKYLN